MQAIRFPRGLPADEGNDMKLISGYTGAGRYKCLADVPEEKTELSLLHCGWESCVREDRHRQDLKEAYVLGFCLNGSGTLGMDRNVYHLEPNDVLLALPGREIWYETEKWKPWTYMWIGFSGICAETILASAGFSGTKPVRKVRCARKIGSYIDRILEAYQTSDEDRLKRNGMLLLIFAELIRDYVQHSAGPEPDFGNPGAVYVKEAVQYIDLHYNQKVRIQELADQLGVNRSYLTSSFQKALGCSPRDYLVRVRMEKAREMLIGTNMQISVVAASVGYSDPLSFSKTFKESYSMSPRTYRKIAGKEEEG
ncbi:HTH-type transcriptional activator RhaS [Schaedlerella arabinosiphila]|nr:HTH-type transcriptional activator RhaS [Schaedlerella arabinosiphila]